MLLFNHTSTICYESARTARKISNDCSVTLMPHGTGISVHCLKRQLTFRLYDKNWKSAHRWQSAMSLSLTLTFFLFFIILVLPTHRNTSSNSSALTGTCGAKLIQFQQQQENCFTAIIHRTTFLGILDTHTVTTNRSYEWLYNVRKQGFS